MKLVVILFLPLITFGQKNCSGFIVETISGNIIPYATVGLTRENKGASANEDGAFSIISSFPQVDSLRISSVGYKTLIVAVSAWMNGGVVALQPEMRVLKNVIVSTGRQKKGYTLNEFGHCSWNWFQVGLKAVNQLAQRFEAPQHDMQLTELELCKDQLESIFRIRIYDLDSTCQCPSTDLANKVIEVRSKESHVRINLENYKIFIPGKSFFVAIEWLFIPFNAEHYSRKIDGRKTDWTYYKPEIRYVRNRNEKPLHVWELGFNGRWFTASTFQDKNFQITAELR
jgi:hypothetical protein